MRSWELILCFLFPYFLPCVHASFFVSSPSPLAITGSDLMVASCQGVLLAASSQSAFWYSNDYGFTWHVATNGAVGNLANPPQRRWSFWATFTPLTGTYANQEVVIIAGGCTPSNCYQDMYVATSVGANINWVQSSSSTGVGTGSHTAVVMKNKAYIIGGTTIMYTADAVNWVTITPTSSWFPNFYNASAVADSSNSRIIVAGGLRSTSNLTPVSEVWISDTSLSVWSLLTASPGFTPRSSAAIWSRNGYIYIAGGRTLSGTPNLLASDSWVSTDDGATWMLVDGAALPRGIEFPYTFTSLGRRLIGFEFKNGNSAVNWNAYAV